MDVPRHRLLLIDPVQADDGRSSLAARVREQAAPDTRVDVATLASGPVTLRYLYDQALVEAQLAQIAIGAEADGYDGVVFSCMFDPGVDVAREVTTTLTVIGAGTAACTVATHGGTRFSILAGAPKAVPQLRRVVRTAGAEDLLDSIEVVDIDPREYRTRPAWALETLTRHATALVESTRTEAIVLGCTGATGLAQPLAADLGVAVIDPVAAAVRIAQFQLQLRDEFGVVQSRQGLHAALPQLPAVPSLNELIVWEKE